MTGDPLGLIGLGEAGSAIAAGLTENGHAVAAYDARHAEPDLREIAEERQVELVGSPAELAERAKVIICLTSASVATGVAREFAPALGPGHLYADWNSASPQAKRDVAAVVEPTGAGFVDGAVMAAVPPNRHLVPVLLSGGGAEAFAGVADRLGMRTEVIGDDPGQAAAVKMYRSLLVKGLEALLLECAVGAARHRVTERVFASMNGSLPVEDWSTLASYLLGRTALHGKRRAEELRQVAGTLRESGIEPLLADAGAERLQWAVDAGLTPDRFDGTAPGDYHEVLAALDVHEAET